MTIPPTIAQSLFLVSLLLEAVILYRLKLGVGALVLFVGALLVLEFVGIDMWLYHANPSWLYVNFVLTFVAAVATFVAVLRILERRQWWYLILLVPFVFAHGWAALVAALSTGTWH